ncbi:MAG: aminotransferase class IV, partial [Candidatus Zixiibacteriota bacterium]
TPLTAGCLEGMTRKHIIELAKADNIPVKIKNIKLADLLKSDEIFVTSSLKLILPVISVTADKKYAYKTGKITGKLRNRLWDYIR